MRSLTDVFFFEETFLNILICVLFLFRATLSVAVADVSLSVVPSVAVEGRDITMRCTWSAGTETSVAWGKGDTALTSGDRIVISGDTLTINPARRDDTGDYSCTVSNPVSVQTTRISLTVYCK